MNVYLNGQIIPIEQAKISPLDRGFLFGDGVYEVIPVFNRQAFALEKHLARLDRSLSAIRLSNPHSMAEWRDIIAQVINGSGLDDIGLYLQVTRGAYEKRDHLFPKTINHTVFLVPFPMTRPSKEATEKGLSVVSRVDFRWQMGHVKSTSLLGNVLLRDDSASEGADETVLFRNGFLTEGSSTNIFVVKDGQVLFVPSDHHILTGCAYEVLREVAIANAIPHTVRPITREEVFNADELLITSSLKMLLAITSIDGRRVGHGATAGVPGPMFRRLHALIWAVQKKEPIMNL